MLLLEGVADVDREFLLTLERIYTVLDDLDQKKMDRDYPVLWEKVHATSCAQVGRMLAQRRGQDAALAALACAIHDIGRWFSGQQADHARRGEEPARWFLQQSGLDSERQDRIVQAVINHSDKEAVGSPLDELVKDADILDCFWHGDDITRPFHAARLKKLLKEIGI